MLSASPSRWFGVPTGSRCAVRRLPVFHADLWSVRLPPRFRGIDRLLAQPGLSQLIKGTAQGSAGYGCLAVKKSPKGDHLLNKQG